MDVPILSSFFRPIFTVFFNKAGETGDIYNYLHLHLWLHNSCVRTGPGQQSCPRALHGHVWDLIILSACLSKMGFELGSWGCKVLKLLSSNLNSISNSFNAKFCTKKLILLLMFKLIEQIWLWKCQNGLQKGLNG